MGIETDIRKTRLLYEEMQAVLGLPTKSLGNVVPRISAWSPLQQLDHISKANRSIFVSVVDIVTEQKRHDERPSATPTGRLVLRTGIIPRGIGKSPRGAMPGDDISAAGLEEELKLQVEMLDVIASRLQETKRSRQSFKHHYFGNLTPKQWMRFVRVHTNHHMKIVREILSSGRL